ncbi:MAG: hypothetical protein IJY58_03545 [Alphaproteobacteria bacterium]|nr:hypothetical protein [Alphaproteobacteria bacterium]
MNKKYIEEIDDLNANEQIHEPSVKKPKNIRRIMRTFFIGFLSVLCLVGIVLIHKLHKDSQKHPSTGVTHFNRIVNTKLPVLAQPIKSISSSVKSLETVNQPAFPVTQEPAFLSPTPSAPSSDNISELTTPTDTPAVALPVSDKTDAKQVAIPVKKTDYTLQSALIFKEHFLKGLPCVQDYQRLLSAQYKTPEMMTVLNNLSPYCASETGVRQNIKDIFLKEKKRSLIAGYEMKNAKWLAYVKALVVSVIEIRKLNPTTSKPKDIIYQAQNELYHQNIRQAVALLKTLPPHMQDAMSHFFREADIYIRADDSLNKLILSFEHAGE